MDRRQLVIAATAGVVAAFVIAFAVLRWDDASKLATALSALAAVAAVGVGIWAALGTGHTPTRGTRLQVSGTGRAVAQDGGRANSGVTGSGAALAEHVQVERTGDAEASGGGQADSGVRLD